MRYRIATLFCLAIVFVGCKKADTVRVEQPKAEPAQPEEPRSELDMEWPDTTSPQEDEERGVWILGTNINGIQYKKAEVSPGKWQYVRDDEAMKRMAEDDRRRRELFRALQTRVLTDEEMQEVHKYGDSLNIDDGVPYYADEKQRELNEAFYQQSRLRTLEAATN